MKNGEIKQNGEDIKYDKEELYEKVKIKLEERIAQSKIDSFNDKIRSFSLIKTIATMVLVWATSFFIIYGFHIKSTIEVVFITLGVLYLYDGIILKAIWMAIGHKIEKK